MRGKREKYLANTNDIKMTFWTEHQRKAADDQAFSKSCVQVVFFHCGTSTVGRRQLNTLWWPDNVKAAYFRDFCNTQNSPGAVSRQPLTACGCHACSPTHTHTYISSSYLADARMPMGRDGGRRTGESGVVKKPSHSMRQEKEKKRSKRMKRDGEWKVEWRRRRRRDQWW